MVSGFDKSKISPGGFLILTSETDVTLPNGEFVPSGYQFRNDFHYHHLSTTDMFVPCGGRPGSITLSNINKALKEDGYSPKWKIIVEGANLFITQDARMVLEKKGVVLYKDASANKGGVTSSSLEVLAALALSDEEHKQHMQVHDKDNIPEFYQNYVKDIQSVIASNARKEFECIWRENKETGVPRCILTDKVSKKINDLNDTIQSSNLYEDQKIREVVLKAALPPTLTNLLSLETILSRVPENYTRAIFGAYISATFIYTYGINSNEFSFFDFMNKLMEGQKHV